MDAEQIAAIAGPALIIAGIALLALVALRPPSRADGVVPIVLDDVDDVHPGVDDIPHQRLPAGAERVLASLTEIRPDPRNTHGITTTHADPSRVSTPAGDPDTGVIRVLDRSEVQRAVPENSVGRHPSSSA